MSVRSTMTLGRLAFLFFLGVSPFVPLLAGVYPGHVVTFVLAGASIISLPLGFAPEPSFVLNHAVLIHPVPQRQTLATLRDDRQHRAGHRGHRRNGMIGLADADAVDGRGQIGTHMPFQQITKLVYRHVT